MNAQKLDQLGSIKPSARCILNRIGEFPPVRMCADLDTVQPRRLHQLTVRLEGFFGAMSVAESYSDFHQRNREVSQRGRPPQCFVKYARHCGITTGTLLPRVVSLGNCLLGIWKRFQQRLGIFCLLDRPSTLRALSRNDIKQLSDCVMEDEIVTGLAKVYDPMVVRARNAYQQATECLWNKDKMEEIVKTIKAILTQVETLDPLEMNGDGSSGGGGESVNGIDICDTGIVPSTPDQQTNMQDIVPRDDGANWNDGINLAGHEDDYNLDFNFPFMDWSPPNFT